MSDLNQSLGTISNKGDEMSEKTLSRTSHDLA
jgi:hypothetical protein